MGIVAFNILIFGLLGIATLEVYGGLELKRQLGVFPLGRDRREFGTRRAKPLRSLGGKGGGAPHRHVNKP